MNLKNSLKQWLDFIRLIFTAFGLVAVLIVTLVIYLIEAIFGRENEEAKQKGD